jgi:hypothetical protein
MINFKLKDINHVIPAGTGSSQSMAWFWLTDSYLWLSIGENKIYEYSNDAIKHFEEKSPYSSYPLSRFLEDLTGLFDLINESIPPKFYDLTLNINSFLKDTEKWLEIYETDEDEYSDFYFEEYDSLVSWNNNRCLDSGHLIGGPGIFFYRCDNKIRIVWDTEHKLEDGIDLWSARNGSLELDFCEFIEQIDDFGARFFFEMDKQVELAIDKDWGSVKLDKNRLIEEHAERKYDFYERISILKSKPKHLTVWNFVNQLYERMEKEIKTKV